MIQHANRAIERLRAGELSLGLSLRQARGGDAARIALTCGFDWLFIDLEHAAMSIDTAAQVAHAGLEAGITPIVRVGGHEPFHANRVLTNGALGVIFPHVDTAAQAAACAASCRFAPRGIRGVPATFPALGYDKPPLAKAIERLNAITSVIVMIESRAAVADVDAIAAVDGVDILFVGASDLSVEMGKPGAYRDPEVLGALEAVAAACRRHGKVAGLGGIGDHGLLSELIGDGYRFLLAANDLDLMMIAGKARTRDIRALRS